VILLFNKPSENYRLISNWSIYNMVSILKITAGAFLLLCVACSSNKKMSTPYIKTIRQPAVKWDKQGHRGCRGLMPENTIPAMLKALEFGVTTLEMDASITKDEQVVLSHEPFFNHEITTKPDGSYIDEKEERNYNMYKMTYEEVKKFDVGMKPHPRFPQQQKIKAVKPRLADLFDSINAYMMTSRRTAMPLYNIETKCLPATDNIYHPEPEPFVEALMKVIMEKGMEKYVTIQSFDFRSLQYLHRYYPNMQTAMLIEDDDKTPFDEQLKKLGFTASIYSPHFSLVTPQLVKQCHAKNMRLIPWTVNDKNEIERLKDMGVDGIISDYPNLFQ
jgi:glycerophosphoryl diester phosphodiesterase